MSKEKIIIIGSGGHAKIILDILEKINKYEIIGVVTEDTMDNFNGYPILGNDEVLSDLLKKDIKNVAMGIGGLRDNFLRKKIFEKVKKQGFNVISVIDPSAIISKSVSLGEGVVIFAGVVINTGVFIGNNVIIATSSTIDHETKVEDHVLISAGVTIGANDLIQEGALLSLGSKVISGLKIGKNILVGAGAVVVSDCMDTGTYLGVPARKVE
jgi:sugar O-acyltransferase (sialic acid O-acetyltransferase NeuD family)